MKDLLETKPNGLHIDGVNTFDLVREYSTPLFVFSERRIRENIARINRVETVVTCPLKICYAAKALSTMAILRTVRDSGCDIEVNSGGELWKALEIGFRGDQIIFNGTSKEVWEIEKAIKAEIYAIQVDSLYELTLIEQTAKRVGKRANVSFRLVPEIETNTHSGLQTALLTSKFGIMPDEAFAAFRDYKESPHLELCGIHIHIGSQNPDPDVYSKAFQKLFESLVRIHEETGIKLKHLNLGGGFPVDYIADNRTEFAGDQLQMLGALFDPGDAIAMAWSAVTANAESANAAHLLDSITLLIEPGRSIIADAGICLTTVRNLKTRPVSENTDHRPLTTNHWLLTDAGFNILLSMETYKWYYHLISATRPTEPHDFPYKVAGPLCDGGDVYFDIENKNRLPEHRLLPANIQPGEILALLNCGAYSLAQASQYNGRFLPAVVLIRDNKEVKLIRKRDDFADLIANEIY